jgi:hypothetical protein
VPEPVDHVDVEVRFRVVLDRATVPVDGTAFRLPPGNYDVTMMRHYVAVMVALGETVIDA